MRFERDRAKPIENVSEAQLLRGLKYMHGISKSRFAILSDADSSYVQMGGGGMTCCLEWRDLKENRHFRAFQTTPVVPWPGLTALPLSAGDVLLSQNEYFRIQQVTEAFLAFYHDRPFPAFIHWRDVTDEIIATSQK
jgi:hypothetical protein